MERKIRLEPFSFPPTVNVSFLLILFLNQNRIEQPLFLFIFYFLFLRNRGWSPNQARFWAPPGTPFLVQGTGKGRILAPLPCRLSEEKVGGICPQEERRTGSLEGRKGGSTSGCAFAKACLEGWGAAPAVSPSSPPGLQPEHPLPPPPKGCTL